MSVKWHLKTSIKGFLRQPGRIGKNNIEIINFRETRRFPFFVCRNLMGTFCDTNKEKANHMERKRKNGTGL